MTDPAKVRVIVVDDHEFFRTGVIAWLAGQPGMRVLGQAASLAAARELLAREEPDLLLLDLGLPDGDGIEFIRQALESRPQLRVIVLSQRDEAVFADRAIRAGAHSYLMKSEAAERLLEAIGAVMRGGTYLSRAATANLQPHVLARQLRGTTELGELSDRELQVFSLIGSRLGPAEIASRLGISAKTVETYREHLKQKLRVQNSTALARIAERWAQGGAVRREPRA